MKRSLRTALLAITFLTVFGAGPWSSPSAAVACPGCKTANETDDLRPRAYMYSILFMLGMPATVFTGFGIAFYRLSKRAALEQQQQLDAAVESPADGTDGSETFDK